MAVEYKLPDLGEGVKSADVVAVHVAAGEVVADGQTILELETEKAGFDLPADFSGRVVEVLVAVGEQVEPGQVILTYEPVAQADTGGPAAGTTDAATPSATDTGGQAASATPATEAPAGPASDAPGTRHDSPGTATFASPSVRRFAREIGLNVNEVQGTGPAGRVSMEDVKKHAREHGAGTPPPVSDAGAAPLPDFARFGPITREPFSKVRRATVQQMSAAWSTAARVTLFDKVDVTDLEALRERHRDQVEAAGGKLTLTVLLLKLTALALKAHPKLNASLDLAAGEIVLKDYVHIGLAVDTPRGLMVPVIRDTDRKSLSELALEVVALAEKARAGKVPPADLQGGTFSLTNLGGLGVGWFTPVINVPEVGILGLGRAVAEPVVRDGQVVPRLVLPLSLSFDHRLVDGADGARFLQWLHQAIEQPLLLILEG